MGGSGCVGQSTREATDGHAVLPAKRKLDPSAPPFWPPNLGRLPCENIENESLRAPEFEAVVGDALPSLGTLHDHLRSKVAHSNTTEVGSCASSACASSATTASRSGRRRRRRASQRVPVLKSELQCHNDQDSMDAHHGDILIERLRADPEWHRRALSSIQGHVCKLAFESTGCRIVQEALDGAEVSEREIIVAEMRGHVRDAVSSPHANFVIQKIVEMMPAALASFVADELRGVAAEVARHRYGCRILCRLVEHQDSCSDNASTARLIEEILVDARQLCLHSFARHVVDSVLEHGTSEQRHRVAESLRGSVVSHARKRSASYTVENAFVFCSLNDKETLANELLADPARFLDLAAHDAGSHVVRALLRMETRQGAEHVDRAKRILLAESDRLQGAKYGQRLLDELKLLYQSA